MVMAMQRHVWTVDRSNRVIAPGDVVMVTGPWGPGVEWECEVVDLVHRSDAYDSGHLPPSSSVVVVRTRMAVGGHHPQLRVVPDQCKRLSEGGEAARLLRDVDVPYTPGIGDVVGVKLDTPGRYGGLTGVVYDQAFVDQLGVVGRYTVPDVIFVDLDNGIRASFFPDDLELVYPGPAYEGDDGEDEVCRG